MASRLLELLTRIKPAEVARLTTELEEAGAKDRAHRHTAAVRELAKHQASTPKALEPFVAAVQAAEQEFADAFRALEQAGAARSAAVRALDGAKFPLERRRDELAREVERTADPAIDETLAWLERERLAVVSSEPQETMRQREGAFGPAFLGFSERVLFSSEASRRRCLEAIAAARQAVAELKAVDPEDLHAELAKRRGEVEAARDAIRLEPVEVAA